MKQISIKDLTDNLRDIDIDRIDGYLLTFRTYLSYFSVLENITNDDILRGLGFVYSKLKIDVEKKVGPCQSL